MFPTFLSPLPRDSLKKGHLTGALETQEVIAGAPDESPTLPVPPPGETSPPSLVVWAQKPSDLVGAMLSKAGFSLSTLFTQDRGGMSEGVGPRQGLSVFLDGELGARAGSEDVPSPPSHQDLLIHTLTPSELSYLHPGYSRNQHS